MKKLLIVAMAAFGLFSAANAQEKESFKVTGSPIVTIFANYGAGIGNENSVSGFNLERAYFGYSAKLSNSLSAKVCFDMGSTKVSGSALERVAYVKNAQFTWKKDNLTVDFGLIGLNQFSFQENAWGYRYLARSFQDEYGFGSSADMGIDVKYKFADWVNADITVSNGEGYKKLNADNNYRYGFGLTLLPIDGLSFRFYYDLKEKNDAELENQTTLSLFAGYSHDFFSVGAEYNTQTSTSYVKDANLDGISLYATGKLSKQVKVFARYDQLSSNEDWNAEDDGSNIIAGLEYTPCKYLKIAPNVQSWKGKDAEESSTYFYLSVQFKL